MGRDQEANTSPDEDMKKLPTRRTYNIKHQAKTKHISEEEIHNLQSGWLIPKRKTITVLSGVSKHLEKNTGSAFPVKHSVSGRSPTEPHRGYSMKQEQNVTNTIEAIDIGQKPVPTSGLHQLETKRTFGKIYSRRTCQTHVLSSVAQPASGIETRVNCQQPSGSSSPEERKSGQTSSSISQIPTRKTGRPTSLADKSIPGKPSLSLGPTNTGQVKQTPASGIETRVTGQQPSGSSSLEKRSSGKISSSLCQIPTRKTARPTSLTDKLITGKPSLSLEPKDTGQIPVKQTPASGIQKRVTGQQPSGSSSLEERRSGKTSSSLSQIPTRKTARPTSRTDKSITGKPSLSLEPKKTGQIPVKQTPTSVLLMPEDPVWLPVQPHPVLRCTSSYKCISARPSSNASFPISSMEEQVDSKTNSGVKTSTSVNNETHDKNEKRGIAEDTDREYIGSPNKISKLNQSKCVGTRQHAINYVMPAFTHPAANEAVNISCKELSDTWDQALIGDSGKKEVNVLRTSKATKLSRF